VNLDKIQKSQDEEIVNHLFSQII